jgi:hypothetical protein
MDARAPQQARDRLAIPERPLDERGALDHGLGMAGREVVEDRDLVARRVQPLH